MNLRDEATVIEGSEKPITRSSFAQNLQDAGVAAGDVAMIHTSISRMGWIVGGVQTLLDGLFDVVGSRGTLVMPGFSSQLSDPAGWERPPVPGDWHKTIRDEMPVFDAERTSTHGLSKLNEAFRALKSTRRSTHPIDSFLANGLMAETITENHPLSGSLGSDGPLGRLYDLNAKVVFLGSGFDTCTCFHLAEYDRPNAKWARVHYPTSRENGVTLWPDQSELLFEVATFARIGADFEAETSHVRQSGEIKSFGLVEAVDFARNWYARA